ncbi:MAG TPA: 5'/3'-nucleotidase SurE [Planctomycetes bacterium]|nr:5'/3'-nucleotidase SurE [Planctomycetota bacterium]
MHILLTNDDGIFAPGLAAIYKKLTRLGRVSVVAPAESKSGASHSISFEPLMCDKVDLTGKFAGYSVNGSPADCVKLGIMELTDEKVDLVVSGMNHGANVGVNVYYSGTVAAAMEAAFFSIPSVALSVAYEEDTDFDTAAEYGLGVIEKLLPLSPGSVININVPMLSKGEPKGVKVVSQSTSGYHEHYTTQSDEHGQTLYQLGGGNHRDEKSACTDTVALFDGFITVTALHFDMTDHEVNQTLERITWHIGTREKTKD